jgi:hypothetical protein
VGDPPDPTRRHDFDEGSLGRVTVQIRHLTPAERQRVAEALSAVADTGWDRFPWVSDLARPEVVHMLLEQDLMLSWREHPADPSLAQILFVGHPEMHG